MPSTPGRTLVALHSRQRFLEIVPLDNRFHARSGHGRRAFDCSARRIGFGPSGADASGFTRRLHSETQLEAVNDRGNGTPDFHRKGTPL